MKLSLARPPLRASGWTFLALLLPVATAGLGFGSSPVPDHSGCEVATESSWGGGNEAHWQETARFGDGADWVNGLTGAAFEPSLGLVVYDGSQGLVWVLEEDLELQHSFGQIGQGPGELEELYAGPDKLLYPSRSFIAASTEYIHVWDQRRFTVFDHDGGLVETRMSAGDDAWGALDGRGIRFLAATSDGVAFGHSGFNNEPPGEVLTTGQLVDGDLLVTEAFEILRPSGPEGVRSPTRTRSVWASDGRCVVFGDDHSPWLVRMNLQDGQTDTIPLPDREERPVEPGLIQSFLAWLGWESEPDPPPPTQRWDAVAVDPDGHVWIHDRSTRQLLRVGANNEVVTESLGSFPRAFGPPGVVYTSREDPMAGTLILRMEQGD